MITSKEAAASVPNSARKRTQRQKYGGPERRVNGTHYLGEERRRAA